MHMHHGIGDEFIFNVANDMYFFFVSYSGTVCHSISFNGTERQASLAKSSSAELPW